MTPQYSPKRFSSARDTMDRTEGRDCLSEDVYPEPFLHTGFSDWSDASLYRASYVFTSTSSDRLTYGFCAIQKGRVESGHCGVWIRRLHVLARAVLRDTLRYLATCVAGFVTLLTMKDATSL